MVSVSGLSALSLWLFVSIVLPLVVWSGTPKNQVYQHWASNTKIKSTETLRTQKASKGHFCSLLLRISSCRCSVNQSDRKPIVERQRKEKQKTPNQRSSLKVIEFWFFKSKKPSTRKSKLLVESYWVSKESMQLGMGLSPKLLAT